MKDEDRTTTFCRTPGYLAPELLPVVDHVKQVENRGLGTMTIVHLRIINCSIINNVTTAVAAGSSGPTIILCGCVGKTPKPIHVQIQSLTRTMEFVLIKYFLGEITRVVTLHNLLRSIRNIHKSEISGTAYFPT